MPPEMKSALPQQAARAMEIETKTDSLEAMAERTQPLLDSGRFAPTTEAGLEKLARTYYFSMRLPDSYYPKKHEDRWTDWAIEQGIARAYIAMLEGDAIGVGPVMAIKNIHMINNIPTMSADLMFGRMLATRVLRRDDFMLVADRTKCVLTIGVVTRKPELRLIVEAKYEDFKHLHNKDNWKNHPEDMLVARAKSRACKRHAPDLFVGLYSREEIQDLGDDVRAGLPVEVPAEFMPGGEQNTEAPVTRPISATETPQEAPAKPVLNAKTMVALEARLAAVGDSATAEDVAALRADVEAYRAVSEIGFPRLVAAWGKNPMLGDWEVVPA